MNKEQIEEMVKVMPEKIKDPLDNSRYIIFGKSLRREIARIYYDAGYRKVTDGAVVLTPEERDEEMKEINKTLAERDELKAENERLKEVIADQNELCWNCNKSVKEFAEKLRKKVISLNVWEFGEIDIIDADDIDELLKEYEK